jgi:surfeit locus 1 family protein
MSRRSLLWPTIFSIFVFCIFLILGTWQVQRLHWKEGLIAARAAAVSASPVALPHDLDEARALEFNRVAAKGTFQHAGELYLQAIAADGKPGYRVVTPLLLDDGQFLFVDRGFVPEEKKNPKTRSASAYLGEVTITGLLRLPRSGKPSWFTPDNDPRGNRWFYVDLAAMAAADRIDKVLPFYVDSDVTANPGGYPVGGQTNLDLPNDHLQYAVTWYGLAAAMPVLYFFFWRKYRRERAA